MKSRRWSEEKAKKLEAARKRDVVPLLTLVLIGKLPTRAHVIDGRHNVLSHPSSILF